MTDSSELIFDSPPSAPDDRFWLDYGRQMISESLPAVRSAGNALIMAIGVMEAIYLGILGFGEFIPASLPFLQKIVFALPLLIWLSSIYCCIGVVMTGELEVFLYSPEDIQSKATQLVQEKQCQLQWGFWLLVVGLVAAFVLFVVRLYWKN